MNEQFDRALRNHIRDTFDHYDDLMADDGWKKFNEQKRKKRRGLIFWYGLPSGIAAALAIVWLFNISTKEVITPKNTAIAQKETLPVTPSVKDYITNETEKSTKPAAQKRTSTLNFATKKSSLKSNEQQEIEAFLNIAEITERPRLEIIIANKTPVNSFQLTSKNSELTINPEAFEDKKIPAVNQQEFLAFNSQLLKNTTNLPKSAIAEEKESKKKNNNKFNFAVDANTYYSFTSAGVNEDINLGIGVLSELKLTKRLSVNSGISLNRQSAVYQGSQQTSASQNYASMDSPNSFVSSLSKNGISVPENIKTDAKLIGFDIPINLKYNIPLGKIKSFVSGGISSYSLINQSYVNDVSVTNYSLTSAPTKSVIRNVDEEQEGVFSNFQFARTINFSFGILYPVSSKNSFSVEPFLKYPISGFGNQNLEIGSGGVSFKLNFGK